MEDNILSSTETVLDYLMDMNFKEVRYLAEEMTKEEIEYIINETKRRFYAMDIKAHIEYKDDYFERIIIE